MGKTFSIRAGERQRVLWIYSSSISGQTRFTAEAADGGVLTGNVDLVRRRWFAFETQTFPLRHHNRFDKGFTDADYRIYVTPDQDCRITFETRHFRAEILFKLLAGLVCLGLLSGLVPLLFR